MIKSEKIILFCVEQGILEEQAILLAKSINRFLSNEYKVIAFSPRRSHFISSACKENLESLGVEVYLEDINTEFNHYPIANKLISSLYIETAFPNSSSIMFVDTDTVFLNCFKEFCNNGHKKLMLRPVDNKGPGTEGVDDPNDRFWRAAFEQCRVPLPEPGVETTVRPSLIRNYFNAGFVWANGLNGFFNQWHNDFMTLVDSGLRPFDWQSRDGDDFRCLDQVALAVTATRYQENLKILPQTFNYPIPFKPLMQKREKHPDFDELVHVHYHKWFQHPGFLRHVTTDHDKTTEPYQWLINQLPLKPEIDDEFKC